LPVLATATNKKRRHEWQRQFSTLNRDKHKDYPVKIKK
jgi:hypothetical protein